MQGNGARGTGGGVKRPPVLAWLRLARVFQRLERALVQQLRAWDLSLAQFDLLAHVGAAEGLTQQELADRLLVTKGNVCQLLEKLERRGLVVRRPEGRANRLFLTPAGRALFQQVVPAHEDFVAAQFAGLSPAEQRQLLRLLRTLDRSLER